MTARADRDLLRSLLRIDGWFTVGLVVLICATLAWSLDDALLVLGRDEYTDFLFWAAIGGFAAGFLGPLVGWSRWTTHAIGAIFAALLIPLLVGWVLIPPGANPGILFQRTTDEVVAAWSDLVLAGRLSTPVVGHHLLVLGLIAWGSAQFASYAAFGHRRPINAVVVIGLLLIGNMALTVRPQLIFLVIFSIASLFLLVRFHTLDEQSDWLRRRIGDPAAISALYLRGGTVFIIAAISGSLLLTNAASSSPLAGAWTDVGSRVVEWGQFLERYLPNGGSGRNPFGPTFGDESIVGRVWQNGDTPQLRVEFPTSDPTTAKNPPFLAAAYYNEFDLGGWRRTGAVGQARDPGQDMLAGTSDAVGRAGRKTLVTTITPSYSRREVFIPGTLSQLDQSSTIELVGAAPGFLASVDRNSSNGQYTITTLIPGDEKEGGPTEERLRAAGTGYPKDVVAMYGKDTIPDGALGPKAIALLADIVEHSPSSDPYDVAKTIESTLRDPAKFRYDTDLNDENCQDDSIVECFADIRAGFCQYYASTMAIFLRELSIPSRYVQGFLPGEPDASGGGRTVRAHDAHAWVQAYFPGYGWMDFDPTGGPDRPQLAAIPSGVPVPSGTPKASGSGAAGAIPSEPIDPDRGPNTPITRNRTQAPPGLFIAIALLLGIVVASVAAVVYRRGPRGPVTPDDAYGSVSKIAARLGFGPRPTQTVYEYAGALADELPMVRPELETVARAKVEVAYGGRMLTDERMANLKSAYRRLRVQLLRLVARRRRRPTRWRR
jgi:Transglutaminase-like superfamily/Domain of unknown function (DUF4129)